MNKQTQHRHAHNNGRPGFDPATAPLLTLVEKGFAGKVLKLGEVGGTPSKIVFTDPRTRKETIRTFARGVCDPLEVEFLSRPENMTGQELIAIGYKARVIELGEKGGKYTRIAFKNEAGEEIVRSFPRGMYEGLEQGFMMHHGVRVRPPARRRLAN